MLRSKKCFEGFGAGCGSLDLWGGCEGVKMSVSAVGWGRMSSAPHNFLHGNQLPQPEGNSRNFVSRQFLLCLAVLYSVEDASP